MFELLLALATLDAPQPPGKWLECVNAAAFSSDCFRLIADSKFRGVASDGRDLGAAISPLMLVERCVLAGDAADAACAALDTLNGQVGAARVEGPVSDVIPYRRPALKWDVAVPTLADAQRLNWYLLVNGEKRELANVVCDNATGQTPAGSFSCTVDVPDLPPGLHTLALQSWINAPPVASAGGVRVLVR